MSEEKWDYEKTMKFIRLIHSRPIIWKSVKEYVKQCDRDAAIMDVAERMKTTPNIIRKKLKSMRESCYKENLRMQAFKDFKPQWLYFHQYRFILRNKEEDYQSQEAEEPDDIDEILWVEDECKIKKMYDESDMNGLEPNSFQYKNIDACNINHLNIAKADEFALLGQNIANELRRLEGHGALQSNLKNKITLAMLKAIEALARQKVDT